MQFLEIYDKITELGILFFIWPANKSQEAKWNFYKILTEEKVGTTNRPSKRSEKRNAVVSERSSGCAVLAFRIDE